MVLFSNTIEIDFYNTINGCKGEYAAGCTKILEYLPACAIGMRCILSWIFSENSLNWVAIRQTVSYLIGEKCLKVLLCLI